MGVVVRSAAVLGSFEYGKLVASVELLGMHECRKQLIRSTAGLLGSLGFASQLVSWDQKSERFGVKLHNSGATVMVKPMNFVPCAGWDEVMENIERLFGGDEAATSESMGSCYEPAGAPGHGPGPGSAGGSNAKSLCAQCGARAGTEGPRLRKCGGCRGVRYCSRACQVWHWHAAHGQQCSGRRQQ